jgi:pyroglutamyl-peptidase
MNGRLPPPRIGAAPARLASRAPCILVTGFGPFPGVPVNDSAILVAALRDAPPFGGAFARLHMAILPTDWGEAPARTRALIEELAPDLVLHFGVSARARDFQIETRAFNLRRSSPDCAGRLPGGYYVKPSGPPVLDATLPAALLVRQLNLAGIPASLSSNAGRYLCNATLYSSLLHGRSLPRPPRIGFVHIPALTPVECGSDGAQNAAFGFSTLHDGAGLILQTLARFMRTLPSHAMRPHRNRLRTGVVS